MLKLPSLHFNFQCPNQVGNLCGVPVQYLLFVDFSSITDTFCRQSSYWTSLAAFLLYVEGSIAWKLKRLSLRFTVKFIK